MKNPFRKDPPRSDDDKKKDTYIHQGLTPARRKDEGERRYREVQEQTRRENERQREREEQERRRDRGKGR